MTEFPGLDDDVAAVVSELYRPGAPPLYELPLETIRRAVDKLSSRMQPRCAMELEVSVDDFMLPTHPETPVRRYSPATARSECSPIVVYFHGGGWVTGDEKSSDGICRAIADGTGATVLSVGYRLAPENPFPAGLEDCYAATAYIDERRDRLGLGPGRIVVAGDSAGATLALSVGLLARDRGGPQLAGAVLVNAPLDARCVSDSYERNANGYLVTADMMRWYWDCYLGSDGRYRSEPTASPIAADLHDLPPIAVVASGVDPLHDEAVEFARLVRGAGGHVQIADFPGTVHGLLMMLGRSRAADAAMTFVNDQIRHFAGGHADDQSGET